MASPYLLSNQDLSFLNSAGQDFSFYWAFLNPIAITTTWSDLNLDNQGNWQPPPNVDTAAFGMQPYAPTVCMGPNRIGFVGEPLYFDGSRSYQRYDMPVASYSWTASGPAVVTPYANTSQVGITWSSPGIYTVTLTVTNSVGTPVAGVRQVMVYQDRGHALTGVTAISGLSGSLSGGGWQCQVTTVNSQFTLQPPDGLPVGSYQPVVLLCETRYEVAPTYWIDRTIGPHGQFTPGQPYNDPRILFDGYIQNGTMHQDIDKDTLSFTCQGPFMILQETKTHQIGYYNTTASSASNGVALRLNTSAAGQGFLVNNLMSADVIHSLLQDHCTLGTYHDIIVYYPLIPVAPFQQGAANGYYVLAYTTLSVNEGTIWQNISDITTNEWGEVHCGPDGSIRVGPQVNMIGGDYWNMPTLFGTSLATQLINFVRDLGFSVSSALSGIPSSMPQVLPALPVPIQLVHPWGNQPVPATSSDPFGTADPTRLAALQALKGPPVLCLFSDTPVYDTNTTPPAGLLPWVSATWPQDLAIYPISFDISENYTGRTALVKLVGTLFGQTTLWTSWYPQNTFAVAGDGISTLVTSVLPAGDWKIDESHLIGDVTTSLNKQLVLNWWWEMARRVWYNYNVNYNATVTAGMMTFVSLGDVVSCTRQNNTLGPHWNTKPFYVSEIDYTLDLTARTWQTTLTLIEVTSAIMGPIQAPPAVVPNV